MRKTIRTLLDRVGTAARPSREGFTLLELLIAVGALAIVSVGVAAIFEATGRTVQTGRRVSAMATYASLIERQLRQDFSSMTRDGFLIVKNMYATGTGANYPTGTPPDVNEAVPLSSEDDKPRLRRTDEIMFFVKGQYVSVRELLDGRYVAAADAAAIYYGHGQKARAPQNFNATDPFYQPTVNSTNVDQYARLGFQGTTPAGTTNPNRFASDWILVRQLTLLRPPQTSPVRTPVPAPLGMNANQLLDSDVQVALQPAASNLFRSLSSVYPTGPTTPATGVRASFDTTGGGWLHPFRGSGLVDIATTDLAEIKAVVTTADVFPGSAGNRFFTPTSNGGADGTNMGVDGKARPYGASAPFDANIIFREQAWMDDALPAWSDAGPPSGQVTARSRLRCESAPNNYIGVLSGTYPTREEEASRRADQIMLSASNFLPHCSEFIVEWSFGTQYTSDPTDGNYIPEKAGQMVWYGMPRFVNGDMVANTYGVPVQTQTPLPQRFPYPWDINEPQNFTRVNGSTASHDLDWAIVHSPNLSATQDPGVPVTSYFGYTDPTFDPEHPVVTDPNSTHNGLLDLPTDARNPTLPWAWPRFIRITMSLADPNNVTSEQSFQFVFEVPGAK